MLCRKINFQLNITFRKALYPVGKRTVSWVSCSELGELRTSRLEGRTVERKSKR